jgi:hypothetical protein
VEQKLLLITICIFEDYRPNQSLRLEFSHTKTLQPNGESTANQKIVFKFADPINLFITKIDIVANIFKTFICYFVRKLLYFVFFSHLEKINKFGHISFGAKRQ